MSKFSQTIRVARWVGLWTAVLTAGCGPGANTREAHEARDYPEARAFVAKYQELENRFDPKLAELYADDAVLVTVRKRAGQPDEQVQMTGQQLKELIPVALPGAAQRGETQELRDIGVSESEGLIEVRAIRYSSYTCYEDSSYRMWLKSGGDHGFEIVRETRVELAESTCP